MARVYRLLALLLFTLLALPHVAEAQTTGGIRGVARDSAEGDAALPGVGVYVTSGETGNVQYTETDENGAYELTNLEPGTYTVMFKYLEVRVRHAEVLVRLGKVTPVHVAIDSDKVGEGGEIIDIHRKAPSIDIGSTKQGPTIDEGYMKHIPIPGRSWAESLGVAPGSQGDLYGVGISGSSSLESGYYVDGVNVTGLNFGETNDALVNEFLRETEIITGGYGAEFGRSTGGVVNVVTKSGGNHWRGSVFMHGTSEALTAAAQRAADQQTSIEADVNLAFDADVGFEIGGPIVKDRLFVYAGFAPRLRKVIVDRVTQRRVDRDQDSVPDIDDNGFYEYEELDRQRLEDTSNSYQFITKLNYIPKPSHQGQLSFSGTPVSGRSVGIRGEPSATQRDFSRLTTDLAFKWTSKFHDNKTELEAVVGWHRVALRSGSIDASRDDDPRQDLLFGHLATWGRAGGESARTLAGCRDGGADVDAYPLIRNCPDDGFGYSIGGIGALQDDLAQRVSARVAAARRVRAAGHHLIKFGADVEDNRSKVPRHFSGDSAYTVILQNSQTAPRVEANRYVSLSPNGTDLCGYEQDEDGNSDLERPIRCDYLTGSGPVTGRTINWSAFAQDSWSIRPNITLNAGLRYEEQRLRYAEELQGTIDPITGDQLGTNALVMRNMWAPRLGLIYDPTKQGRSKIYGHWGRFFESIPMRINERSFGGETFLRSTYGIGQCGDVVDSVGGPSGENCATDQQPEFGHTLFGAGTIIAPGVAPQYMDEVVLGAEYELFEDLRVGVAYKNRRLGRVLEDVSTDNADTYVIANPGEFDAGEEAALVNEIEALPVGDAARAELERRLEMYRGIRKFDRGTRNYDALEVQANKRFSRNFYLQAAYTYSRTRGNFPGLFSPDTGQLDPNITSQFDLIELLSNRSGPLPQDRPHYLKFDGYYQWDFESAGVVTTGARFRALSGTPVDALGRHHLYGRGESYLLPRGSMGRTPFDTELDLHAGYARNLQGGMQLEIFVDVYNIFNRQSTMAVDEEYTLDPANPIVGGDHDDLVYLKRTTLEGGLETSDPVGRKLNFLNTSQRLIPASARFGVRLTF